jgi:hypothetical protein
VESISTTARKGNPENKNVRTRQHQDKHYGQGDNNRGDRSSKHVQPKRTRREAQHKGNKRDEHAAKRIQLRKQHAWIDKGNK